MTDRTVRWLLLASAFLASLLLVLAVVLMVVERTSQSSVTSSAVGGPFKLVDHDGKVVTDQDFKGRPFLVFFGFTHCPDVCPTTLFDISEVMRALGPDADKTAALFVTVDPERDTPDKLKDYLSSFDPHVRGLTGGAAEIDAMQKTYRVYSRKVPTDGGGYTMDHTALVYLMGKDGRFVAPFSVKRRPQDSAAELRKWF
jgi:protein SCO1/2